MHLLRFNRKVLAYSFRIVLLDLSHLFSVQKRETTPPQKDHHHQPTPKPETIFLVFSWKRMSY